MQDILQTFPLDIHSLPLYYRGKVRDSYQIDNKHLVMVATDRISAFDVVLPSIIPKKGIVLTQISQFWSNIFKDIPQHHVHLNLAQYLNKEERSLIENRSIVVKQCKPLPIEAIVRGYIIGSGWQDYQKTGSICGISLPQNLQLAEKLPTAIFTPSSKAALGQHDENISFDHMVTMIGKPLAEQIRSISLDIYQRAQAILEPKGLIIADTKLEFGLDENNQLLLIDEILTPDSSRYWSEADYQIGKNPPSFDKQFIRDYLNTLAWNHQAPGPSLPQSIIQETQYKYQTLQDLLL